MVVQQRGSLMNERRNHWERVTKYDKAPVLRGEFRRRQTGVKVGQLQPMQPVSVSMWEWRLSRGATCQRRWASFSPLALIGDQPRGPGCSAACHACPSHAARSPICHIKAAAQKRRLFLFASRHADLLRSLRPDIRKRMVRSQRCICPIIGRTSLRKSLMFVVWRHWTC